VYIFPLCIFSLSLHPPTPSPSTYSYRSLQEFSVYHLRSISRLFIIDKPRMSCLTCWQKVITLVLYILDYPIYLLCTFICSYYIFLVNIYIYIHTWLHVFYILLHIYYVCYIFVRNILINIYTRYNIL